jgi:ribosomal protein S18 acetylase RimI-like enzyme
MVAIREHRAGDETALLDLARELQSDETARFERMKPGAAIGRWYLDGLVRACAEHEGAILVAVEDERVVGYATILTRVAMDELDEEAYEIAQVGDLVVTAAARGRGVARALLVECERRARDAGRDELRIEVLAHNQRARAVYRAAGYSDLLVMTRKRLTP